MFDFLKKKKSEEAKYEIDLSENSVYFGASGSGFVDLVGIPAIKKCVEEGESFVVTDFKGFILKNHVEMLRENGYQIKVFDFGDPYAAFVVSSLDGAEPQIQLEDVGKEKTAVFILLTNTIDHAGDEYAVTLVTEMVKRLMLMAEENYDETGGKISLPVSVRFIINDDLRILKKMPNLIKTLAVIRKYGISFTMRFYSMSYLSDIYEGDLILGTCNPVGFLGGVYSPIEWQFVKQRLPLKTDGEASNPLEVLRVGEQLLFKRGKLPLLVDREGKSSLIK